MCQVNGPSYSVTCDHCDKSMRNTDDICPHCKHNYSGGTMSEQQVLRAWTQEERQAAAVKIDEIIESQQFAVETIGNHGYTPGIIDIQCELTTLRASLAQSEAERARLQQQLALAGVGEYTGNYFLGKLTITGALRDEITKLTAELARERGRHQDLREVVKEYRQFHIDSRRPCVDSATCSTCQEAIALLEPAPVATGEE